MEISPQARIGKNAADLPLATRFLANLSRRAHFESDVLISRLSAA
jgi:hypothetical protein